MGASISVNAGQIDLEVYTYGISVWSGDFNGFVIDDSAR